MLRHDASALFRFVLLSSAVSAGCGGAVEGTNGSSGSTSGGASSGSTSSGSSSGSTSSSSGGGSCLTGTTAFSEDYCCPPGTSCPNLGGGGGGGGDGDAGLTCDVDCARVCAAVAPSAPSGFRDCSWSAGQLSYYCGTCGVGRVPADTEVCPLGDTVAERLARQAYYEAASVVAFERLTVILASAHAPRALVERARAAAKDESRHASLFAGLAAAHGATPRALQYQPTTQSLLELALENATEGCVRETFGALVTLHQAAHAETAEIRAAFAATAEDEAEHAALSWELRAWFDTRLGAEERARVQDAHLEALAAARRDALSSPDAPGRALGLPSPARALRMLDTLMGAMALAA